MQRAGAAKGAGEKLGRNKAWKGVVFSYFRFFGPTEPFFEKTWVLPDFEKIN